jgi:hypothetical protein
MLEELSSHFRKSSKSAFAQRGVSGRFNGWLAGVSLILYDKPAWDNISGWVFGGLYYILWQIIKYLDEFNFGGFTSMNCNLSKPSDKEILISIA